VPSIIPLATTLPTDYSKEILAITMDFTSTANLNLEKNDFFVLSFSATMLPAYDSAETYT